MRKNWRDNPYYKFQDYKFVCVPRLDISFTLFIYMDDLNDISVKYSELTNCVLSTFFFWAHFLYHHKFIVILSSCVKFPIILRYMENFLENVQILFPYILMLIVECQTDIKCYNILFLGKHCWNLWEAWFLLVSSYKGVGNYSILIIFSWLVAFLFPKYNS